MPRGNHLNPSVTAAQTRNVSSGWGLWIDLEEEATNSSQMPPKRHGDAKTAEARMPTQGTRLKFPHSSDGALFFFIIYFKARQKEVHTLPWQTTEDDVSLSPASQAECVKQLASNQGFREGGQDAIPQSKTHPGVSHQAWKAAEGAGAVGELLMSRADPAPAEPAAINHLTFSVC